MPASKNIIVVDTVGEIDKLHRGFMSRFPFVKKWFGHEPDESVKDVPHPHGGMCMGEILLPLWNDGSDINAHFIRIFDSSGRMFADHEWVADKIKSICLTGPAWINCSWGGYIGPSRISCYDTGVKIWRDIINETHATVMWASGNNGDWSIDVDEEVPQGGLTDISFKIAAGTSDGRAAEYSGDSVNAPPIATFWSTSIRLLNPVTNNWEVASGTSFAAPKATGLAAKRSLDRDGFSTLAVSSSISPVEYRGPLPHPKWGYGWLEGEYQKEIEGCPYLYDARGTTSLKESALEWFEFELLRSETVARKY